MTSWRLDGVVDAERLHRLLRRVSDDQSVLRSYAGVPPDGYG